MIDPVALQLAKGGPFAPTSWGAFGPNWLWVASAAAGPQNIAVGQAVEVETANTISPLLNRRVTIGTAHEVELARLISPSIPIFVPVQTAVERELARMITPQLGPAVILGSVVCEVLAPTAACEVAAPSASCVILSPSATCEVIE